MSHIESATLKAMASVAVEHAMAEHSVALRMGEWEVLNRILVAESRSHDVTRIRLLEQAYGAWLGEAVLQRFQGEWVGWNEPTPPRLLICGLLYSPFDVVRRKLIGGDQRPIGSMVEEMNHRASASMDPNCQTWEDQNRRHWNERQDDPRFSCSIDAPSSDWKQPLDPWIQQEGDLNGRRVLCLGAGGGTHGPSLAFAGAIVTVMDLSPSLLAIDQAIASRLGLSMKTIEQSMVAEWSDELTEFDLILQPVSGCYIPDLKVMYERIAKALKPNGVYVFQAKQPSMMQMRWDLDHSHYIAIEPYAQQWPLPPGEPKDFFREHGAVEFLHTWDELLGSLCRAGLIIEAFEEPPRGDAWAPPGSSLHKASFFPPYCKIKARKKP